MRKILSASCSWQEFSEFLSAYSDTLYDKHKIKTSLADERIEDVGYGMTNEWWFNKRRHRIGCTGPDPTNFWESNMGAAQYCVVAQLYFNTTWTLFHVGGAPADSHCVQGRINPVGGPGHS